MLDYIKIRRLLTMSVALCISILSFMSWGKSPTQSPSPPQDPTQSINYWKRFAIDPSTDSRIQTAQAVFSTLLRTWDAARVEPDLYIVESNAGPWAASLSDGNILLSKDAINVCFQYGADSAQHLLAFILGHELAHQRAEDLWHQKFLRLAGSQAPEIQEQLLKDLQINPDTISQLEQREAQADHDGLLIMASVGYDPFRIIDDKDFFTNWVENLWNTSCNKNITTSSIRSACSKAKNRALRTRSQLTRLASQNTLFELGVQAYVAGNFNQARDYFNAFGKEFPSHAVFTNIGITYLQEAINLENQIASLDDERLPFVYPVVLSASPLNQEATQKLASSGKRGAADLVIEQLKQKRARLSELAIAQFEKSIRLHPTGRENFILIASSYLVDDNAFMTRGILQGKYLPKFGVDRASNLLLSITAYKEKNAKQALTILEKFDSAKKNPDSSTRNPNALRYVSAHNKAVLLSQLGRKEDAQQVWNRLAQYAKNSGNGFLFQVAVEKIRNQGTSGTASVTGKHIQIKRQLGKPYSKPGKNKGQNEIWFDGDKLTLLHTSQNEKLVLDDQAKLIRVLNTPVNIEGEQQLVIGDTADRPLKLLGLPDRQIHLASGDYLAYDRIRLAIHIINNQVSGWFLYEK